MPFGIRGRTQRGCFDTFLEHLNPLVQSTLPTKVPLQILVADERPSEGMLTFYGLEPVSLTTKHGRIYFWLSQSLECVEQRGAPPQERYLLKTRQYWYRIQLKSGDSEAIVRWEYLSPSLPVYKDHGKRWCWRHVQMPQAFEMPKGELDLDKVHLPSGYVVIEDIIRFLITDFGVKPPCGAAGWPKKLADSEKRFFREFNAR